MSHKGTTFASDRKEVEDVLKRNVEQSGRFSPASTAEDVAAILASDIAGKTVIITGASPSGLGAEAARVIFQQKPKLLILASRRRTTIDETIAAISGLKSPKNVKGVELDLADLDSIRKAAAEILALTPVVDVLINNAGIMMIPEFTTTKQGIELQFGTNHLGHFLLTNLLVPALLKASAGSSVVNISSAGHRASPVHLEDINFDNGEDYTSFVAYGQSKTTNILFSVSLSQKLKKRGLRSFSVDPGGVPSTGINRQIPHETKVAMGWFNDDGSPSANIPWSTVEKGAASYIVAAFDRTLDDRSGTCIAQNNIDPTTESYALDPETAEKLWTLSEKLVDQEFQYT